MRNMSFHLTERQLLDGTKDVTRRIGWAFLKRGDQVCAIRKGQGLKKGEKVHRLGVLTVVNHWRERLQQITYRECVREGFPDMTPDEFIRMFCREMGCEGDQIVNRIAFTFAPMEIANG